MSIIRRPRPLRSLSLLCIAFLIGVLIIGTVPAPLEASTSTVFTVGSAHGKVGDTVTVDVTADYSGAGSNFYVLYDKDVLQPVALVNGVATVTGMSQQVGTTIAGTGKIGIGYLDTTGNGITSTLTGSPLFSIQFQILQSTKTSSDVSISLGTDGAVGDLDGAAITNVQFNPGTVSVDSTAISVTKQVSSVTTSGFNLQLTPAVANLASADISLMDGATPVNISSANTNDNGANYAVVANLTAGKTYKVNVTKAGYTFDADADVAVPAAVPSTTFSVGSAHGKVGDTVTVDVTAAYSGAGSNFYVLYDKDVLQPVALVNGVATVTGMSQQVGTTIAGTGKIGIGYLDTTGNGITSTLTGSPLFSIQFQILQSTKTSSDVSISLGTDGAVGDLDGIAITNVQFNPGTVTVDLPTAPAAPTNPTQDDVNNTFGWTNVTGYSNVTDYEYSVDGGNTWTTCTANPQTLADAAYAAGAVQVRVKADSTTGAGAALSSTAAYTVNPPVAPAAPTNPIQDDVNNTFGWTNVTGYPLATDYRYSVDGGNTWTPCTANPQPLSNAAYAVGAVQVRVKGDSSTGRPAGAALSSTAAYTVNVIVPTAPAAPTIPVQDDVNNTFGWTNVTGYSNVTDYEYSVDGGNAWTTCTANPQTLADAAYAVGAVQVRVKADSTTGQPAGDVLSSTAAYTVSPVQPLAYKSAAVDSTNKKITLTFSGNIFDNTGSPANLKNAVSFSANGTTFSALGLNDTVAISGKTLVITLSTPLQGTKNKVMVAAGTVKDSSNNVFNTEITTAPIGVFDECFIATAAFGSKYQTDVVLLRHFRDQFLMTNPLGRAFVQTYYHYSPPIAQFIAGKVILKLITRILLLPLVIAAFMLLHPVVLVGVLAALAFLIVQRRRKKEALM